MSPITSLAHSKPISQYPACVNDLSFWIDLGTKFECNDFYDLVRSVAGDIVQQVVMLCYVIIEVM